MALKVYKSSNSGEAISSDSSFSNPIFFQSPTSGGEFEKVFYLKGTLPNESYGSVELSVYDNTGTDESGWIKFAPDNGATPGTYASTLSIANIAEGQEVPFWIQATIPDGRPLESKMDIKIKLKYIPALSS